MLQAAGRLFAGTFGSSPWHHRLTRRVLFSVVLQDWNTPGKMWCDGARQSAVFKACLPTNSSSSNSSSKPSARTPVVAAAAATNGGSSSSIEAGLGGGAVHVVPAGSSHGSFTDLPFLLSPWVTNLLRKTVSNIVYCMCGLVCWAAVSVLARGIGRLVVTYCFSKAADSS
jgi:hypothetical protein